MKFCSNHCRSNAMQFAADQRGGRRGHLATVGGMQCLFESSDLIRPARVGIVVLRLEVLAGWSFVLKNEVELSQILSEST